MLKLWVDMVVSCMKHYFKGYKFKTFIAIFLKFVEACFELLMPLLMVVLIDEGILKKDVSRVYQMVFYMFLLTVFGYLASITCQYFASIISQRIGGLMRHDLMHKVLSFEAEELDVFGASSLINRVSIDVIFIQDMIARTIRLAVRAPMIIFGSVFALYYLNPDLGITLLKSLPLFVFIIVSMMFLSMKYHQNAQKSWDTLSEKLREFLEGARIIFAFNKSQHETKKFEEKNNHLKKSQMDLVLVNAISGPMTALVMNAMLILLVYLGGLRVESDLMTQGQILALINYCTQIVLTLIVFMNLMMIFSKGTAAYKRVSLILQREVSVRDEGVIALDPNGADLHFNNVSFSYPNEKRRVLKDLNFTLKKGETLGIIGVSGSGKSSLVRLIMRLYDVSEGSVFWGDHDLRDVKLQKLRESIAYVPQKAQFISGDIALNVTMDQDGSAQESLKLAMAQDVLDKGLDYRVESFGRNLSGGQKQRLSIARAFNRDASLMIFDDSFSALDALTAQNLRKSLNQSFEGVSKIIVSQRTSNILESDHILVLDQGSIVAQGTHELLLQESTLYAKIHQLNAVGDLT